MNFLLAMCIAGAASAMTARSLDPMLPVIARMQDGELRPVGPG